MLLYSFSRYRSWRPWGRRSLRAAVCKTAAELWYSSRVVYCFLYQIYSGAEGLKEMCIRDSDIVGIDIDISRKIAEKLGVELEVESIEFDSLVPALQSGKADMVAAGMTADEERRKNVDFSESYYDASQVIIVAKDGDIASPEDLKDKTVGVQQGTTGDKYCTNEDGKSEYTVGEVKRLSLIHI